MPAGNSRHLWIAVLAIPAILGLGGCGFLAARDGAGGAVGRPLPEFEDQRPSHWLNSPPLSLEYLRGKVVFLEIWTHGCGNCVRTVPWVRQIHRRFAGRGLVTLGVHSPEFEAEKDIERIERFAGKHGLEFPILVDNDLSYWRSLDNRYWPAVYLVDRNGIIRHVHIGETHPDTDRARGVERWIEKLLREAPDSGGKR